MRLTKKKWEAVLQSSSFILVLLAGVIILVRLLTFNEPFERDLMVYAVTARELLSGRPLYADLWDIKPPGIYWVYALSQLLVGYNRWSIFLLGVSSAIITLLGIFQVVTVLTRHRMSASWSAFFWALLSGDVLLQANQPNVEVFLNAAFVWALFYFVRAYSLNQGQCYESRRQNLFVLPLLMLFAAGFLWAIASLLKQVALVLPILLSVYVFFYPPADRRWQGRLLYAAVLLLPIFLVWATVAAYFTATNRWEIFHFTMIDYGRLYASQSAKFTSHLSWWMRLWPASLSSTLPIVFLLLASTCLSRHYRYPAWKVLVVCAFAIQVAIILPGNYFAHYYQLWLPWVCIAVGVSLSQCQNTVQAQKIVVRLCLLVGTATFLGQWVNWNLTPDQISIRKYSTSFFVNLPKKAREIDALLLPDETFYEYGFDAGLYFETKRRPPVGIINVGTQFVPLPRRLQDRIIADLKRTKPEMAIIDHFFPASPVTQFLNQHYVPVPHFKQSLGLVVMARRGGNLLRRNKPR